MSILFHIYFASHWAFSRIMKLETCVYSGYKIHPGHGKRIVRIDGKTQIFLSKRCFLAFYRLKRNPRDIPWTVLYRRKYKKGIHADTNTQKKRVKRVVHPASRPIGNVTVESLLATRNQKPEFRKAQRDQAIKAAKDAQRAKKQVKKASAPAEKAAKVAAKQQKAAKPVKTAQPRVGGKR
uniref:TRASH domain-containing protein n=1 Tax=Panagrolaimus sp. JU765 TaxID=591449 RepID=A0AC34QXC4_9BILA